VAGWTVVPTAALSAGVVVVVVVVMAAVQVGLRSARWSCRSPARTGSRRRRDVVSRGIRDVDDDDDDDVTAAAAAAAAAAAVVVLVVPGGV